MESKSLLFGIIGFIAGGLIVSIAASTGQPAQSPHDANSMSMSSMTESLESKTGSEFDKEFLDQMIAHHQGAVDMAKLAADRAEHSEIKTFSNTIVTTQSKEVETLKTWQKQWDY